MMDVVRQVRGLVIEVGGEQHEGWLPDGAAVPRPAAARRLTVDVTLECEAGSCMLICTAPSREDSWDQWFGTLAEAEDAAERWLGIAPDDWESTRDSGLRRGGDTDVR